MDQFLKEQILKIETQNMVPILEKSGIKHDPEKLWEGLEKPQTVITVYGKGKLQAYLRFSVDQKGIAKIWSIQLADVNHSKIYLRELILKSKLEFQNKNIKEVSSVVQKANDISINLHNKLGFMIQKESEMAIDFKILFQHLILNIQKFEKGNPMKEKKRPEFIKHYKEILTEDNCSYPDSKEKLSIGSPFGAKLGLKKIGIHHDILPPGRRTSWPHAEKTEEEFAYVIEGHPDAWINGDLYRLNPGDGVGFPSGTGIAHTFINNTDSDVRLLVIGEASKEDNKYYYPCNPERKLQIGDGWWSDVPKHKLGSHKGLPDKPAFVHGE